MTDLHSLKTALSAVPVVPVLTVERLEDAVPLASALGRGGLTVLEVTLRTEIALAAISAMREAEPDLLIGAGTITKTEHVSAAIDAGAQFLVSPGVSPELADAMLASEVPALPGTATASEAMSRAAEGFEILKLFPAVPAGGLALLKSLSAPLPDISFMPTGGINATSAPDFLALPNVLAVGGSWMVDKTDVSIGNWKGVEEMARMCVALVRPA